MTSQEQLLRDVGVNAAREAFARGASAAEVAAAAQAARDAVEHADDDVERWCRWCAEPLTANAASDWENSEGRLACPAQPDTYHRPRED